MDVMANNPVGQHVLLDFFGCACDFDVLSLVNRGLEIFAEVGQHFSVRGTLHEQFQIDGHPHGYSILLLLAESHISIHTWPEKRMCSLDLYTCSGGIPEKAIDFLMRSFDPEEYAVVISQRGLPDPKIHSHTRKRWGHSSHELRSLHCHDQGFVDFAAQPQSAAD